MSIIYGQLVGPFSANEELITQVRAQENAVLTSIFKIGIFSKPNNYVTINNVSMEIGKTGMLEVKDTEISSLSFNQNEDTDTQLSYFAEIAEE